MIPEDLDELRRTLRDMTDRHRQQVERLAAELFAVEADEPMALITAGGPQRVAVKCIRRAIEATVSIASALSLIEQPANSEMQRRLSQ